MFMLISKCKSAGQKQHQNQQGNASYEADGLFIDIFLHFLSSCRFERRPSGECSVSVTVPGMGKAAC